MTSNIANTLDHQQRLVGLIFDDGRVVPGVEFFPNVVITNPRTLERLTETHRVVEHVEPYRMTFVSYGSCDYCGPMPEGKSSGSTYLPGDYHMGIITCDKCRDKALLDIKNYCIKNLRYLITTQKLEQLGLAGDLKIKRSSGEVQSGWRVDTGSYSFAITFGKDGKILIPMINVSEYTCKGVRLNDICDLNGLNFQELFEKIQEM
jgi:hypothetical protein